MGQRRSLPAIESSLSAGTDLSPWNRQRRFTVSLSAADQGNADAQLNLGFMYANGRGVPQDDGEAVTWYRKAADQGDADGQVNLGAMYQEGHGVPQDDMLAYAWVNLGAANATGDLRRRAVTLRDQIAKSLPSAKRLEAQARTRQWFADGLPGELLKAQASARESRRRTIPENVKRAVWQRDQGRCVGWVTDPAGNEVQCGSQSDLEYDHIIPVSKGGSNTERNIQLLCERCNRLKAASI